MTPKRYDHAYFDRWYRHPAHRVTTGEARTRRAGLAVAVAEHLLGRRLRSVLDIGCGEGAWRAPILALRPRATYLGVDSSPYAVSRFGRSRNVTEGRFGDLARLPKRRFDLVVSADVLHYLSDEEIRAGLPELAARTGGAAYLPVFTAEDGVQGDLGGFRERPAAWYRAAFRRSGLEELGLSFWGAPGLAAALPALDAPG